ncbi:MAG TPA: sensor histidine kinase [Micropepsaceae bacterium]|nr:sensor histidine kinase [Micropepsaceae bacterium]
MRERLIQTARSSAADEENLLASGEQVLRALANQPEVNAGAPDCGKSLANAIKGLNYFTNIARIDARGELLCAAVPPPPEQGNVADRQWWKDAPHHSDFFITPQIYSVVSHRNVLGGVLPLRNASGAFDGVMALALDVGWLDVLLHSRSIPAGAVIAVFDPANTMVASNDPEAAEKIFAEPPQTAKGNELLSAAANGENWSYVLVPLLNNTTKVGFAMRERDLFASTYLHVTTDLLLPVLMLGLASAAIWIFTDRQITRWIVYLRRIATAYARGHYAIRPVALEEAPSEFRTLGETFSAMAAAVQDRDRRLREALDHKSLMIKETHHRVKNNLQIVMSLLSLQAGKLRDPVAKDALRQAQMRVNALALVHRILHEIEDLGSVDVQRLIRDLAHQIHEGFGAERRDLRLEVDIVARQAPSDIAVPLTLFTVEALTNAFKHAYPVGARGGVIRVSLAPIENGKLRLAIEDDGLGVQGEPEGNGIGTRLIQAFAQQIGGTATVTRRDTGGTVVELIFPDPLFEPEMVEPVTA